MSLASVCRHFLSGIPARAAFAGLMAALAALPAAPALAKEAMTFTAPPGCTGFLTVQSRGCRVSNHYRCEADAPGDQWRADFDQEGIFFVSRTDFEAQWVESYDMFPTVRQTLDPNPADPASFSELLANGFDSFEFGLTEDTGTATRVTGFDRLTGRSVTVDGVTLQETEFEFTEAAPDGSILRRSNGTEYIDPQLRLFFAGPSQWDLGDGPIPVDSSPRQFILPGEPGFFSTLPIFDCDAVLSLSPLDGRLLPASFRP
jgi:hypothetical protein